MSFELLDNLLQVFSLSIAAVIALLFWIRYSERHFLILAFAYACFTMGTLYYVLYLAIFGRVPQIFYGAEISWLASYLFLLSLQLIRTNTKNISFSFVPAFCTVATVVSILIFRIFGPSYFMSSLLALTTGSLMYLSVFRLQSKQPFHFLDLCFIGCILLQISLYVVSIFYKDYTHFNFYFAVDLSLTTFFLLLLPLTRQEVLAH